MTTQPIIESGMTFGPYPEGRCFYIEKSNCYAAIRDYVKMAEFLLLRTNRKIPDILVVEAKSSTPRPENQTETSTTSSLIFGKNSSMPFHLDGHQCLKRHPKAEAELPEGFKTLNLSQVDVKLILVVNGHPIEWLPPLHDALKIALRSTVKSWAFTPASVAVINDALARNYGLIFSPNKGDA